MHGLAAFSDIPWQSGNHPLERKKVASGGLSLLEFAPGFSDPDLCRRSHVFFVLEGTLSLELQAETVSVRAGSAFWLDRGTAHRAANRGDVPVVLFVASDLGA
jgi:quercetin dioxygenase-like cupin family protein